MRIEGYAVVSEDDRITDAAGRMPAALRSDAEWAFFQAGLDAADVIVLGRLSHEVTPNPKQRRRLVMTSSVDTVSAADAHRTVFWNPARTDLEPALTAFGCRIDHLAVAGGQRVFDHFLKGPHRYTAFHLSRIDGVRLPDGGPVFGDVGGKGLTAEDVLSAAGYRPGPRRQLDEIAHVVTWTPAAP